MAVYVTFYKVRITMKNQHHLKANTLLYLLGPVKTFFSFATFKFRKNSNTLTAVLQLHSTSRATALIDNSLFFESSEKISKEISKIFLFFIMP